MIKNANIALDAAIHPSKIMGLSLGVYDYFHVASVDSQYYSWLRNMVPADRLFTTPALGHVEMTADRGDTMLVYSGSYDQSTSPLAWNKDQCHLIGVGPVHSAEHPVTLTNGNADATPTAGNWAFSANECQIQNVRLRHRGAAANIINAAITGDNNVFEDVHFHNMANTALADAAGCKGVVLDGCNNLTMRRCLIGGTEIERTDGAADMTIGPGTCDDLNFYDCKWIADLAAAADDDHLFIEVVDAADIAKIAYFENSTFINCGAAMNQMPAAISVSATLAGIMFFNKVVTVGMLDLVTNEERVFISRIGLDTTEGQFITQAIIAAV